MAAAERVFRFVQFEFPWELGPPVGRYLVRDAGETTTHVLVLATLGAPERRRRRRGRPQAAAPEPGPTAVTTGRATVIEAEPTTAEDADRWLATADASTAEAALATLARAVRAHRIASADPHLHEPALSQALVVRAGYGAGEQVAEGRWTTAHEVAPAPEGRQRRSLALAPQERIASLLGGRTTPLACEELTLRARHDLDRGWLPEAALQLRIALDAALRELPREADSAALAARVEELRTAQPSVVGLADAALERELPPTAEETLAAALGRLEAALRARAAWQSQA